MALRQLFDMCCQEHPHAFHLTTGGVGDHNSSRLAVLGQAVVDLQSWRENMWSSTDFEKRVPISGCASGLCAVGKCTIHCVENVTDKKGQAALLSAESQPHGLDIYNSSG